MRKKLLKIIFRDGKYILQAGDISRPVNLRQVQEIGGNIFFPSVYYEDNQVRIVYELYQGELDFILNFVLPNFENFSS